MQARTGIAILVILFLSVVIAGRLASQQAPPPMDHQHHQGMDAADPDKHAEHEAVKSMTPGHHHMSAHMKLTVSREQTPEDLARADAVVKALRESLERYKDYRTAIADGYQPFLPNIPQPQYHFTSYWNGFLEAFSFEPTRPTSLLYKKTAKGYELVGAMYTMPKNSTEDQLNQRVPLSVAAWHLHTNLCMPQKGQAARADWTKFGLAGSISTPEACARAGGNFMPSIFGWMVHAYPFENTREKIWAHQ